MLALGLIALLALDPGGEREVLVLRGGARIEGLVIKENEETLFVDLGFSILSLPRKEILSRAPSDPTTPEAELETTSSNDHRDYLVGAVGPDRAMKDLASELGSSVVLVSSPGKSGSGFFVNRRGFVITNHHVVEGEQKITLTAFEKRPGGFEKKKLKHVRILAVNPYYDLAVLQVPEEELKGLSFSPAAIADTRLVVGEAVFAIGNPQGFERTLTEGIVSTTDRAFEGLLYIQTTTQINPGNSGGPLFNLRGEVVGVTNMKAGFFSEGLGFAIPVRRVKEILDHREAFAFDADNPNTGYRYLPPPMPAIPQK